ncbi:acetyl-CoA carboxylase biotin carboxyl carrier protein [Paenibacillus sp. FSL R10-2734]|uniref:acetyl-CoA carboxylase biotin carboxyl carrier protein n=1 Tax=Paenibacillus sp. FSL R10-2734 TaxID=2954691 RepID=UPI0030D8F611
MFKLSEIKELIKLLDQTSSVHELEIESEGMKLAIRKPDRPEADGTAVQATPYNGYPFTPAPQPQSVQQVPYPVISDVPTAQPQAAAEGKLHKIVSPMVGTFYSAASPELPSFVNVGDRVSEKTTVCIIEAMKLMNELEAEIKGEIVSVLAENGQLVEYGQPLFLVKPE